MPYSPVTYIQLGTSKLKTPEELCLQEKEYLAEEKTKESTLEKTVQFVFSIMRR